MKNTFERKGKEALIIVLLWVLVNTIVKMAAGGTVYLFLVRYTLLDVRQLAAVIIAMIIADKVSIKLRMKE